MYIIKKISVILLLAIGLYAPVYSQDYILLETKTDHNSPIESLVLAPDGMTMISGHHDGYLVCWDMKTHKIISETHPHGGQINSIIFDRSGKKLITSSDDSKVCVIEYPSMKVLKTYPVPTNSNSFACITSEGVLYFGGSNTNRTYDAETFMYAQPYGALYRINTKMGDKAEIAYNDERPMESGSNITDGNMDYSGKYIIYTKNRFLSFYDIANKRLEYRMELPNSLNNFTSTKDALYVWGDAHLMKLTSNGSRYSLVKTVLAGTRPSYIGFSKLVLSNNEKMLVTGDDGNNVNIWTTDLERKQVLTGHTDAVRNFLFWNNDSILVTGGYDGKLLFWGFEQPPKDTTPVIVDVIFTENNIPVKIKDRDVELQSTITVNQPEFDIEVWDQSMADGDSISLNINGEWILQEYEVIKEKLRLHVKINPNASNNYLILYAHNLGKFSPNTAAVQVLIGEKKYRLQLSSSLSKSGALNFSYVPE